MGLFRTKIMDDRGRQTTLYGDRRPAPAPECHDAARKDRLAKKLLVATWSLGGWQGLSLFVVLVLLFAAMPWVLAPVLDAVRGTSGAHMAAALATGAVYGFIVTWTVLSIHGRRSTRIGRKIITAACSESFCPSCLYDLQQLVPESDGCIVCPECGAAWRHEDMMNQSK